MSTSAPSSAPSSAAAPRPDRPVRTARAAVFAAFALAGLAFATWASRLPTTQAALGITKGQLGLLLLTIAVGSVVALPAAGPLAARVGTARAVAAGAALTLVGLAWAGVAATALRSVPLTALGLVVLGAGNGLWDVGMNLEGAGVERRLGRATMPAFHAAFSGGTVVAAGLGALAALARVPVWVHLLVVTGVALVAVQVAVRAFLPDALAADPPAERAGALADPAADAPAHEPAPAPAARQRSAWLEPRTLLLGVLVLAAAFTEGTANDWTAIALTDGYGTSAAVGAAGFAVFLAAMTAARLAGQRALDRWGRVPVLRATMVLGAVGALGVVLGGSVGVALVGAVLWGAGASLGFPVGISAAADDPRRAAVRVSVVTTVGYTAFLAGPPLLGLLADSLGVLRALLLVVLVAVPSLLVSRVAAPLPDQPSPPSPPLPAPPSPDARR